MSIFYNNNSTETLLEHASYLELQEIITEQSGSFMSKVANFFKRIIQKIKDFFDRLFKKEKKPEPPKPAPTHHEQDKKEDVDLIKVMNKRTLEARIVGIQADIALLKNKLARPSVNIHLYAVHKAEEDIKHGWHLMLQRFDDLQDFDDSKYSEDHEARTEFERQRHDTREYIDKLHHEISDDINDDSLYTNVAFEFNWDFEKSFPNTDNIMQQVDSTTQWDKTIRDLKKKMIDAMHNIERNIKKELASNDTFAYHVQTSVLQTVADITHHVAQWIRYAHENLEASHVIHDSVYEALHKDWVELGGLHRKLANAKQRMDNLE